VETWGLGGVNIDRKRVTIHSSFTAALVNNSHYCGGTVFTATLDLAMGNMCLRPVRLGPRVICV